MCNDIQRFLSACSSLKEVEFQTKVVEPLLRALDATQIEHTHGNNERGKDFLYLFPSGYGTFELHACVVKNGKFSGRANDSNSVQTALQQITTAHEVLALNPETQKQEIPRRVLFVSTHAFPDTQTGNHGQQLQKIEAFCHFLTADRFAKTVREKCEAVFWEVVSPGAAIAQKLATELKIHREAEILKLPLGPKLRVYVDMRLASRSKFLSQYIAARRRPKRLSAEHVEKNLVAYFWEYCRSVADIVTIPDVFQIRDRDSIDDAAAMGSSDSGKIAVQEIALDTLYDYVANIQSEGSIVAGSLVSSDVLFGLLSLLGLLLERFGEIEHSESVEGCSVGIFGEGFDAVNSLAAGSEDLLIIGDPGGGKTFTAQELCVRVQQAGGRAVCFPCSRIQDETDDLRQSIVNYVASVAGCTVIEADRHVSDCSVLIIDGLDEARSLEYGLLDQIYNLSYPETGSIEISADRQRELDILPPSIRNKLDVRKRGEEVVLEATEKLNWDEAKVVSHLFFDSSRTRNKAFERLRSSPRVVVTCRKSIDVDIGSSFRRVELLPFSTSELDQFVQRHCHAAGKSPQELLDFFSQNPYIHDVCRSPLTASIMVSIYLRGEELPASRSELYETRANLLMVEWDKARGVVRPVDGKNAFKRNVLQTLAYEMHKKRVSEITLSEAVRICKKELPQPGHLMSIEGVLSDLVQHHCLLCQHGDNVLTFGHLSHQEFFCAWHMLRRQKAKELVREFGTPWWRNVTQFFVGLSGSADSILEAAQATGRLLGNEGFAQSLISEGDHTGDFSRFVADAYADDRE